MCHLAQRYTNIKPGFVTGSDTDQIIHIIFQVATYIITIFKSNHLEILHDSRHFFIDYKHIQNDNLI